MDISKNSDQTEPETTVEGHHDDNRKQKHSHKKAVHQKKRIYEKLKEQIEFYFSPSNLAKDRFMSKLLQDDPYVPLSLFLSFNKIKGILSKGGSESVIKKALIRSEVLELSEDQTKVRLKEEMKIKTPEEIDESTLYVEQVPINSTIESLKDLFSRFGKVVYVSLPRYKKSRQIKQFGFVEFENKESIIKAINTFKRCDNVLNYAVVKAENLLSIATHEKEESNEVVNKSGKVVDNNEEEKMETQQQEEVMMKDGNDEDDDDDDDEEPPKKKQKVVGSTPVEEESETETSKMSEKETEDEEKHDDEEGLVKKKKKNRKHKKKSKSNSLVDEHVLAMKIMRKKDWKKMRNAYLNMERQKAKEIKKVLRDSYNKRNNNKIQENLKFSPLNTTASPKINFYGSPNDREERFELNSHESLGEASQSSGLAFTPGVIVNIKFREPCSDYKELKKEFKQFRYVNYVDMLEGGSQCYIRCENSASAQELTSQYSSCEYETEVLKDEPEKEYWKKIFEKRDARKNSTQNIPIKKEQVKRRRGRERLLEKIQKVGAHVRFEEIEENAE